MAFEKRQLSPGPKKGSALSYSMAPPALPVQKTFRANADFLERIEERAMDESLRTGLTVRFSDLVRRGLEMVLASEPPAHIRGKERLPCALVRTAGGGVACMTCKVSGGGPIFCRPLSREVDLSE